MRYYNIAITRADGTPYQFKSLGTFGLTSLLPLPYSQNPQNAVANPAALNIELEIAVANLTDPINKQGAWLRIWGLGLQDIGRAAELSRNCSVQVYAGMSKGLPLANPSQAGLLMQGQIWQAFGNWIGTDQTLDMFFIPGAPAIGTSDAPGNFPFTQAAGTPLADAIKNTLSVGVPNLQQNINISPNLVASADQNGHYSSLSEFSSWVNGWSQSLDPDPNYLGVTVATDGQNVNVFDATAAPPTVKQITFTDLIGQPTWIGYQQISITTVMRADIHVGDTVNLPPSLVTATQNSGVGIQNGGAPQSGLTFSGNFVIQQVQHFGNFRQNSADAWVTIFQAIPATPTPALPGTVST